MRANKEDAGVAERFCGGRRRGSLNDDTDAEGPEGMVDVLHGEESAGGDAEAGEEEADGDPEDYEEGEEWGWFLNEAAVVKYDGFGELLSFYRFELRIGRNHIALLQVNNFC